jgi:hypothetical protein
MDVNVQPQASPSLTLEKCPLGTKLGWLQSQSQCSGCKKNLTSVMEIDPWPLRGRTRGFPNNLFSQKSQCHLESEAEEKKESLLALKYQSTHLEIKLHIKEELYGRVLDTNAYFCYSD